jgi:hypothetical protein
MTNHQHVCELAAEIGSSLMPDNAQWVNRFTVNSRTSDNVYTVAQRRSDGSWGCSCWAWRRHRKCPHLRDILQRLSRLAEQAIARDAPIRVLLSSARTAFLDLDVTPIELTAPRERRVLDL